MKILVTPVATRPETVVFCSECCDDSKGPGHETPNKGFLIIMCVVLVVVLSVPDPYKSLPKFPKSNKTTGFRDLRSQKRLKQAFGGF